MATARFKIWIKRRRKKCVPRAHTFTVNARNLYDSGVDGTANESFPQDTHYSHTHAFVYLHTTSASLAGKRDGEERKRKHFF